MSDTYEPVNEVDAAVHAANNPAPEEAPEASAPAEAPQTPQEAPEGDRRYAGKYESVEALERAYSELQSKLSSTRPAEPEPQQQYVDPLSFLPPQIDEATFKRIEASAERDPQGTALWAIQNQQALGDQLTNAVVRNWAEQDFLGFQRWQMGQILAAQQEQQREQWAPIEQHTYQQISNAAVAEAGQGVPDWEDYKPKILEAIQQNGYLANHVASVASDPAQLTSALRQVYGLVKGNEYLQSLQAQGGQRQPQSGPDTTKARTRTETRTSAPQSDAAADGAKAMQNLILGAKAG